MILKIKVHTVSVTDILAKNSRFSSLFAAEELETSPVARSEEKWLRRLPVSKFNSPLFVSKVQTIEAG